MTSPFVPVRLHLARHGAVAPPWDERIYGDLDVPLSDRGREQSQALARRLEDQDLAAVVSSGLARTEYAADLVRAGRGLEARVDPRLRELNRGDWAGWDRAQVEAASPGAWDQFWAAGGIFPVPGGESLEALSSRVGEALDELAAEFAGGEVLVVAHKWVLRAALCRALGLPLNRSDRLDVPHAATMTLEWPESGVPVLDSLSWEALGGWESQGR